MRIFDSHADHSDHLPMALSVPSIALQRRGRVYPFYSCQNAHLEVASDQKVWKDINDEIAAEP